jgi:hypothetical protein
LELNFGDAARSAQQQQSVDFRSSRMHYEAKHYNARWWVLCNKRLLGGYNANALRPYVFPLYSPTGELVIQETPPDHPHHQGVFAGLNIDGYDLWNAGSFDVPRHRIELVTKLAELQPVVSETGVTFAHETRWLAVNGQELLRERRNITFSATNAATLLQWSSEFYHPELSVTLGQTKEAGIGLRVPPHWETCFGGRITNTHGHLGEAMCFDKRSEWLAVMGGEGARSAGVVLVPEPGQDWPWFTRDYGLHSYNPTRHGAIRLDPGQNLTWKLSIISFDGNLDVTAINRLVRDSLPQTSV